MRALYKTTDCLAAALGYAARDWLVLPLHTSIDGRCSCGKADCSNIGKHPRTEHGLKDATRDESTIRQWWARYPDANIGVATGVDSNLVVVDVDPRHGGDDTLADLIAQHGPLPATVESLTGGGGRHILFAHPGNGQVIRNSIGEIGPGLDIRSDGGYVVVPPSVHASGRQYTWEISSEPDDVPLAPLPPWLLDLIMQPNGAERRTTERFDTAKALMGVPEGQRDDALFGLACKLRHADVPQDMAERLVVEAAANCTPPFSEAEARAKVHNAYTRYESGAMEKADTPTSVLNETPIPISLDRPSLPDFPTRIFPHWMDDMVEAVAVHTETPRELPVMLGLAVLGMCCQRFFVVQPEPGYIEPLNIWTVAALDSGNRKTAVMQAMTRPVLDWEQKEAEAAKAKIAQTESERETIKARIQILRSQAARQGSEDFEDIKAEIAKLETSLPEVPSLPRLWSQDITPEKLGQVMAENGERLAILSDEGGIFDILAGRYSGGVPNLDLFLQAHAGSAVRVDRGSRQAVFMQHPALTMGLSPQPEVLRGLADKPGFRGRGLLARFLYVLPPSRLGYRTMNGEPVPNDVTTAYMNGIAALLNMRVATDEQGMLRPYVLKFSAQARKEWKEFSRAVEMDMREAGRFEHITDWGGKLPGAAARIAGLLHCAEHASSQPWHAEIILTTMARALELAAVLSTHALAVFDLIGADPDLEAAKKVWRWVERNRQASFTARDCFQALKGTFRRMADLELAFTVLKERLYIFEENRTVGSRESLPGRPSRLFTVNLNLSNGWQ